METIDTTNKYGDDLPDGLWIFKITKIEKFFSPVEFWVFSLEHGTGNGRQPFFANMLGPLLRILGCEETSPHIFEWDPELQIGKYFQAVVSHEPDKKNPSKIRQHMGQFQRVDENSIPF